MRFYGFILNIFGTDGKQRVSDELKKNRMRGGGHKSINQDKRLSYQHDTRFRYFVCTYILTGSMHVCVCFYTAPHCVARYFF